MRRGARAITLRAATAAEQVAATALAMGGLDVSPRAYRPAATGALGAAIIVRGASTPWTVAAVEEERGDGLAEARAEGRARALARLFCAEFRTPPHTVSADAVTVEFTGASTAAVSRRAGVWFDDEAEGAA